MGHLRVLLALLVLLQHSGGIGGYMHNGGPLAVQAFFIISGFYMALVLNERYVAPETNGLFWLNRGLRIYTLYFAFLALYLAFFAMADLQGGASPISRYFDAALDLGDRLLLALLNITLLGQDFVLHVAWDSSGQLAHTFQPYRQGGNEVYKFMAVPVAWTLALELYFYILAPFIVRRPVWQIALIAGLSFAARIAAALGGLVSDPYSYRFFPFELGLFLLGAIAYKVFAANPARWEGTGPRLLALSVPAAILAWPLLLGDWNENQFFTPAKVFVLALVALALPAIHGWSRHNSFDRTFGELSYPLYLCHLLVIAILLGFPGLKGNPVGFTVAVIAVSMALSWLVVRCLEAPVEGLRTRIRNRASGKGEPAAASAIASDPEAAPKRG